MLGRHIQAALSDLDVEVTGVSKTLNSNGSNQQWDLAEWRDNDYFDSIFKDIQAIIHAGAYVKPSGKVDTARMFNANVRSCFNLGSWAKDRGIPFLFISGAIVYADTCAIMQDENSELGWDGLGGFYGLSKLLAEDVLFRLRHHGLKLAVIRPTSIYGDGISAEGLISRFLSKTKADEVIELNEPVNDRVDLIHAADVSAAILAVLQRENYDVFNISSGHPLSILEIAETCISVCGKGKISVSGESNADYNPRIRFSLNSEKAKKLLEWEPRITFREGIRMLLNAEHLRSLSPEKKS